MVIAGHAAEAHKMKTHRLRAVLVLGIGFAAATMSALLPGRATAQVSVEDMAWAYAISPAVPQVPEDGTRHSLPGSNKSFTRSEIRNFFGPADWYSGDHPAMPAIVATGREEAAIWAWSMCH
jgi:hypothetical protein